MSEETCPGCKRPYSVDEWCYSPDFVAECGRRYHDPEEDATAEIECLTFQLSAATARASELEKQAASDRAGNEQMRMLLEFEQGATTRLIAERDAATVRADNIATTYGRAVAELAKRDAELSALKKRVARAERKNEAMRAYVSTNEELVRALESPIHRGVSREVDAFESARAKLLGLLQPETKGKTDE